MTPRSKQGQEFSWLGSALLTTGMALFTGRAGDNQLHRHYAVQLAFSGSRPVALTGADGRQFAGGIVSCAAGVTHRLEPTDEAIILAYLEPTSTIGAAAQRMLGSISIVAPLPNDALVRELRNAIAEGASEKAESLLNRLFGNVQPVVGQKSDPRVAALVHSSEFRGVPPPLAQAAQRIGLSPSRLSHLFADEMGIAYRAFAKWRKLLATLDAVSCGADLTQAAHEGGFADSAHFSRTFKDTFGLTPSNALFRIQLSHQSAKITAR